MMMRCDNSMYKKTEVEEVDVRSLRNAEFYDHPSLYRKGLYVKISAYGQEMYGIIGVDEDGLKDYIPIMDNHYEWFSPFTINDAIHQIGLENLQTESVYEVTVRTTDEREFQIYIELIQEAQAPQDIILLSLVSQTSTKKYTLVLEKESESYLRNITNIFFDAEHTMYADMILENEEVLEWIFELPDGDLYWYTIDLEDDFWKIFPIKTTTIPWAYSHPELIYIEDYVKHQRLNSEETDEEKDTNMDEMVEQYLYHIRRENQ